MYKKRDGTSQVDAIYSSVYLYASLYRCSFQDERRPLARSPARPLRTESRTFVRRGGFPVPQTVIDQRVVTPPDEWRDAGRESGRAKGDRDGMDVFLPCGTWVEARPSRDSLHRRLRRPFLLNATKASSRDRRGRRCAHSLQDRCLILATTNCNENVEMLFNEASALRTGD